MTQKLRKQSSSNPDHQKMLIKFTAENHKAADPRMRHGRLVRRNFKIGFPTPEGETPRVMNLSFSKPETVEFAQGLMDIATHLLAATIDGNFWPPATHEDRLRRTREYLAAH